MTAKLLDREPTPEMLRAISFATGMPEYQRVRQTWHAAFDAAPPSPSDARAEALTSKDLDRIRQWFAAVEDLAHPDFLTDADYEVADKVADILTMKRPSRMRRHRPTPPAKDEARG